MRNADDFVGYDAPPVTAGAVVGIELVFDRDLAKLDTIDPTVVPVWSIWVIDGADPAPSSRLFGAPTVDSATATKTQQKLDLRGLTVGVYYGFRATVTAVSGQKLSLSSRIRVGLPTP